MKRVSVNDVAAEAGVAIGSVSRALNGREHVSAELRARVQAAAAKLGYRPNAQARGLRLGRTSTIGLLVHDMRHPMMGVIVSAVEGELSQHGQMLLLANAYGEAARAGEIVEGFKRSALDGAILMSAFHDDGAAAPRVPGFPLVLIDQDVDGVDRVCLERRNGMRTAVRHLLSLGHRRIALFTPALGRVPGAERVAGLQDAFRQAGLAPDLRYVPDIASPLQDGAEAMHRLLRLPEPPTALVCLGTSLLSGALRAVRGHGLRIPADFSVIAVGAPAMLELADPPLTCLKMELDELGRTAARLMLRRLAQPAAPVERMMLEAELVLRESCAPAPLQPAARPARKARR